MVCGTTVVLKSATSWKQDNVTPLTGFNSLFLQNIPLTDSLVRSSCGLEFEKADRFRRPLNFIQAKQGLLFCKEPGVTEDFSQKDMHMC